MTSYLMQWSPTKEPDAYDWFEDNTMNGTHGWVFAS
jgi:hypothetical protein